MKRQRNGRAKTYPSKRRRTTGAMVTTYQPVSNSRFAAKRNVSPIEYKFTDTTQSSNATGVLAPFSLLASLARGNGVIDNFVGNKINPVGLSICGTLRSDGSTTLATGTWNYRVIIFQWLDVQVTPTTPVLADILALTTTPVTTVNSPIKVDAKSRIKVLWDKHASLNLQSIFNQGTSVGNVSVTIKKYIKGSRLEPVVFQSATTEAQYGGLFCVVVTDTNSDPPLLSMHTRVSYTDF